ncbi:MAG: helix-turn-helix domain-containing protein [Elusimicrobiaceae bacterium]|nr:helix-turn-helix domain-containing protein [Elusimicrobiaceae bacterium]
MKIKKTIDSRNRKPCSQTDDLKEPPLKVYDLEQFMAMEEQRPIRYMPSGLLVFLLELSLSKQHNKRTSISCLARWNMWQNIWQGLYTFDLAQCLKFWIFNDKRKRIGTRMDDKTNLELPLFNPNSPAELEISLEKITENNFNKVSVEVIDPETIQKALSEYIRKFKADMMIRDGENYYTYSKHIKTMAELFQQKYLDFGKKFLVELADYDIEHFLLPEVLYALHTENLIRIHSIDVMFADECEFDVEFIRSPEEIADIYNFWTFYGDIRVNEENGIAYYKNNKYPFKSVKQESFRLLCYLVRKHGQLIEISEIAEYLGIDHNISANVLKSRIKNIISDIKKNLKISEDNNPTLNIMIQGQRVILIANPHISA